MPTSPQYISTVGRRKEAVARVRLFTGNGQLTVNDKLIHEYFPGVIYQKAYMRPFEITKTNNQFYATIKVKGGGFASQLTAVVHGLSRALSTANDSVLRPALKKDGLLTRDGRAKERRKYGLAHAARAKKQSPKR